MTIPWYRSFFSPDYWEFAKVEYSAERTAREVDYLLNVLSAAPGPRVADLGCGAGRHSIPLAKAGFDVIGLDVSEWAIGEARKLAAEAGAEVRFEVSDLMTDPLPDGELDAVFAIQAFGWGSDADQRRMLEEVRRHLVPGGLLVLDFSSAVWILANFRAEDVAEIEGVTYRFVRSYDPGTGRSRGRVEISHADKEPIILQDDVRLYTPVEAISLVREAGFAVERTDADFGAGAAVNQRTRYAQIIAHSLAVPPRALALTTYAAPSKAKLDARWAPDEIDWLDPSPQTIWSDLLQREPDLGFTAARHYALDDPYGAKRGAPIVSTHFGTKIVEEQLNFGAGVTSLLRNLCGLATRGKVLTSALAHPDLPAWAAATGIEVVTIAQPLSAATLEEALVSSRPALVHLDRPGIDGHFLPTDELDSVVRAAQRVGSAVLVDEAYAAYLEPSASAAAELVGAADNLIVLRSMSKAYSMGGLRAGFAIASPSIAERVREQIPPLGISELAYRMTLELLAAGDLSSSLRRRLASVKPEVIELIEALGLEVIARNPALPWVLISNPKGKVSERLLDLGISTKPVVLHSRVAGEFLRLAVPLSEERMNLARRLLGGVQSNAAR